MTITVFFMILAVVLFIEGIIGMYFIDYLNNKDAAFIGGIFIAGSLIFFMMSIFYPKNCIIPWFYWLIFIAPLMYAFLLIKILFTKYYIFPWKRDYYKEYRNLRKDFDTLQDNYNELNKIYHKLEQSYQKDIKDIRNKQSIENNNNPKLYL